MSSLFPKILKEQHTHRALHHKRRHDMTIKLHCFGESGNAYKAALTMTLAGVEWEPVFVDF